MAHDAKDLLLNSELSRPHQLEVLFLVICGKYRGIRRVQKGPKEHHGTRLKFGKNLQAFAQLFDQIET